MESVVSGANLANSCRRWRKKLPTRVACPEQGRIIRWLFINKLYFSRNKPCVARSFYLTALCCNFVSDFQSIGEKFVLKWRFLAEKREHGKIASEVPDLASEVPDSTLNLKKKVILFIWCKLLTNDTEIFSQIVYAFWHCRHYEICVLFITNF